MQEEFFMNSMEKDPKLSGEHGAQTRKSLALKAEEILGLDLKALSEWIRGPEAHQPDH